MKYYICIIFLLLNYTMMIACEVDPPGHLQPICNYPPFQKVATMDDFPSPEYFYRWLTVPGQPVLFKSVLEKIDYPAYTKWTDDYMREKFGKMVVMTDELKKDVPYPEGNKWRLLHQFLSDYRQRDQYLVQELSDKMKEDIRIPRSLQCGGFQNMFDKFVMWFSSGGTKSYLHNDEYDNINCVLDGVKLFKLIDTTFSDKIKADNYNHNFGYSPVDVDAVDLHKYPQIHDLPWIEMTAVKGDCLFVPKDWFHLVYSTGERNLAVNLWFVPLPWFNKTDCEVREPVSDATKYKTTDELEAIRHTIMYIYKEMENIKKKDLDEMLLETERTEDNRKKMLEYLDVNKDGVWCWQEVLKLDMEDFLVRFIDILDLAPNLDQLKEYLRTTTDDKSVPYSRLLTLKSKSREEL